MKKIKIMTPENIEVEYKLAGLASRSAAAMIDTIIQFLIIILLIIALVVIRLNAPEFWKNYFGWITGITLLLSALILYAFFIVMELRMNGMTIGKKILHIRTIRGNGQPITLKHSAIRNLFRVFIDMFGIGIALMFFSKDNKRLGDMAASTIVVMEEQEKTPVTLESLEYKEEKINYYLTKEEIDIIRDYLERKSTMDDPSKVQEELRTYFTNKFEELGVLEENKEFIEKI